MDGGELRLALGELGISQTEAARLLEVDARTVRTWCQAGYEAPSVAARAVGAWLRLARYGLAWRPDTVDLGDVAKTREQLAACRSADFNVGTAVGGALDRIGPGTVPWEVDPQRAWARLGPIQVNFELLPAGGFWLKSYRRDDQKPDAHRDRSYIEDATLQIAAAVAKRAGAPGGSPREAEPDGGPEDDVEAMEREFERYFGLDAGERETDAFA